MRMVQRREATPVNDDPKLEDEAERKGREAMQFKQTAAAQLQQKNGGSGAVVQRMGGGAAAFISSFVQAHPYIALSAIALTGLAGLYYRYHGGEQPEQNRQPGADSTTLEGIARQLNITPKSLRDQLESGPLEGGAVFRHDLERAFFDTGPQSYLGIVPPSLIRNLPQDPRAKVNEIFRRINAFSFQYQGRTTSAVTGFLNKYGDCNTLAEMFIFATRAAGVEGVVRRSQVKRMLVQRAPIHGRDTTGNTAGETFWFFHDHHWCTYGGQRYDLLFMSNRTPGHLGSLGEDVYNNVHYESFEGGRYMVHADEVRKKLNYPLHRDDVGIVFSTFKAMTRFIGVKHK